jgi:hypothetical protein
LHVNVTEATIGEVTGLPRIGVIWFNKKELISIAKTKFWRDKEQVRNKGKGIERTSLPSPWKYVTYFI